VRSTPARLPRSTLWAFGVAGIAIGTINTGLNFFLLIYYDQVVGLKPYLAGLALALGLLVDGVMDPLVGLTSDRSRSLLGRRHPFILASILPLTAAYLAIWYPPFSAQQQGALFWYLLGVSIALRVSQSLFDVPINALVPELTQDYETRTTLSIYKVSLTWITSNVTGFLMFAIWLKDTGHSGDGLLSKQGYQAGAHWFAAALLLSSVIVPLGLRRYIPLLREHALEPHPPAQTVLRNLLSTYSNRSMLALLAAAVFLAAASGLTNAIWVYLYSFYWACTSSQVNVIQIIYMVAAAVSLVLLPRLSRNMDKRSLGVRVATSFWVFTALPYALRTVGAFPSVASDWRMILLGVHAFFDGVLFNMLMALLFSLLADVVEDSLLSTGRREEGLILASQTFVTKVSTAAGTWLAAGVLTLIAFPRGANARSLPPRVLLELGVTYMLVMWAVGSLSLLFLRRYRITRASYHESIVRLRSATERGA